MVGWGQREAVRAIAARAPGQDRRRPIEAGVAEAERAEDQRVEEPVEGAPPARSRIRPSIRYPELL